MTQYVICVKSRTKDAYSDSLFKGMIYKVISPRSNLGCVRLEGIKGAVHQSRLAPLGIDEKTAYSKLIKLCFNLS